MRSMIPSLQQLSKFSLAVVLLQAATMSQAFAQTNANPKSQTIRATFQHQVETSLPMPGLTYSGPLDHARTSRHKITQASIQPLSTPERPRFQNTSDHSRTLRPIPAVEHIQVSYNPQSEQYTTQLASPTQSRVTNSIASPLLVAAVNSDANSWVESASSALPMAEAQLPNTYASGFPRRNFFGIDEGDTCDEWAGFCECDSCNDDCAECGCGSKHAHSLRKFLRLDKDCRRNSCRSCRIRHQTSCGSSACQSGDGCNTCDSNDKPPKGAFMAELKSFFR